MEQSTFSREQAEVLRQQGLELIEHAITVTTLARVCEQYAGRTIDFLKVDVESYEREVLEGADWGRYRPRVVVVEATRPATTVPSYDRWEPTCSRRIISSPSSTDSTATMCDQKTAPCCRFCAPANVFDQYEIYEYQHEIQELRHAFALSQDTVGKTQTALNATQFELEQTRDAVVEMRRAWDHSQDAAARIPRDSRPAASEWCWCRTWDPSRSGLREVSVACQPILLDLPRSPSGPSA